MWVLFAGVYLSLLVMGYTLYKKCQKKLEKEKHINGLLLDKYSKKKREYSDISRKLVSTTANLALQNDLLSKAKVLLGRIQKEAEVAALSDEIGKTKRAIEAQLKLDKLWEDFFFLFEKVNPVFLQHLKSKYDLTQYELKLCTFTRMNLSNKEIARILHVNHNSINVSMFRLKKKLKLPNDVSAANFLQSDFAEDRGYCPVPS